MKITGMELKELGVWYHFIEMMNFTTPIDPNLLLEEFDINVSTAIAIGLCDNKAKPFYYSTRWSPDA